MMEQKREWREVRESGEERAESTGTGKVERAGRSDWKRERERESREQGEGERESAEQACHSHVTRHPGHPQIQPPAKVIGHMV